eukprot:g46270.t1
MEMFSIMKDLIPHVSAVEAKPLNVFKKGPLPTQQGTRDIPLTPASTDFIVIAESQAVRNVALMTFQEENSSLVPVRHQSQESTGNRDPEADMQCITTTLRQLDLSGWYWGSLTASEAKQQLNKMPEGTFLIRDSSHPSYLLTLSVKTNRGPTNVRIEYSNGKFCLDSYYLAKPRILAFNEVLSLIQHYVTSCIVDRVKVVCTRAMALCLQCCGKTKDLDWYGQLDHGTWESHEK